MFTRRSWRLPSRCASAWQKVHTTTSHPSISVRKDQIYCSLLGEELKINNFFLRNFGDRTKYQGLRPRWPMVAAIFQCLGKNKQVCLFSSKPYKKGTIAARNNETSEKTSREALRNEDLKDFLTQQGAISSEDVQVRVVVATDNDSEAVVTTLSNAIDIANQKRLDLVGVSLSQNPPVVKVFDYEKAEKALRLAEQQKQRQQQLEKQQLELLFSSKQVKEFRFKAGIADNDLLRKIQNLKANLEKGYPCQLSITSSQKYLRENDTYVQGIYKRIQEHIKDIAYEPKVRSLNKGVASVLFQPKKL